MSKNKIAEGSINHTNQLLARFKNLAINRFKWEGLPPNLESWRLEEMLIEKGMLGCYKNEYGVICILGASGEGEYDMYNQPIKYRMTGNKVSDRVDRDDVVIIRNNALSKGDMDDLELFAERINEVEQTMDVNLFQQNIPWMFLCDEDDRLTFRNIINQVRQFKYVIFGKKGLRTSLDNTPILQTPTPYLLDKLQTQKTELMNELLTFLGINNNNVDKKERLVVDEVNANNDFILVNIDHMYDMRKKACDEINKKFGLSITVEKREVEINGTDNKGALENNRDRQD